MLITNWKLLESIETSITEYNNQFWREEDSPLKLDGIDYAEDWESADVPEETLRKLKSLRISLIAKDTSDEQLNDIIHQLSKMLDNMNLTSFSFSLSSKGNETSDVDLSFLEHLNEDIKNFSLTGINLSKESPELFSKFQNLSYFSLQKCNISNPEILSKINPVVFISLERNVIKPEHYEQAIKLIKNSNARVEFSDKKLKTFTRSLL